MFTLTKKAQAAPSADERVKAVLAASDTKTLCGRKLLQWYHDVPVNNGIKAPSGKLAGKPLAP